MKFKIPIKRYTDRSSLTWEERYRRLEAHHTDETRCLVAEIERLEVGSDQLARIAAAVTQCGGRKITAEQAIDWIADVFAGKR